VILQIVLIKICSRTYIINIWWDCPLQPGSWNIEGKIWLFLFQRNLFKGALQGSCWRTWRSYWARLLKWRTASGAKTSWTGFIISWPSRRRVKVATWSAEIRENSLQKAVVIFLFQNYPFFVIKCRGICDNNVVGLYGIVHTIQNLQDY
jgi:hypothetical protein